MELHLFVIWEKGRHYEEQIVDDIRQHLKIVQVIDILWDEASATSNFARFYGVNLPDGVDKKEQCGAGEFRLVIVQDNHPEYALRDTSHGRERVNTNIFDAKTKYRQWIGGPSPVHGTNNQREFNHDITLLLGICQKDYSAQLNTVVPYEKRQQDIVGAHRWDSIEQLFYVLNNTVDYVILRGADELINHTFNENHRDCDILVENLINTLFIVNGTLLSEPKRPHVTITINEETFYLDLWYAHWDYFDILWCRKMLGSRVKKKEFYVLDEENNFYCLLYHCLITKNNISPDYRILINSYKKANCLEDKQDDTLLVEFLQKNGYEIVSYNENGAGFHTEVPTINRYYNRHGSVLGKSSRIQKDIGTGEELVWKSCVYDNCDTILKTGTKWLIRNEERFLHRLSQSGVTPTCLTCEDWGDETALKLKKIPGETLTEYLASRKNYHERTLRNIAQQILKILELLKGQQIIHRDFIGNNLIIDHATKVWIIDFGWAIDLNESDCEIKQPEMLAGKYRPPDKYSDFYTIGAVLHEISNHHLPYFDRIASSLCKIQWNDYFDENSYAKKIKELTSAVNASFSRKDHFHCFLMRHPRISLKYYKIRRSILN